jgi:hypothetical protein
MADDMQTIWRRIDEHSETIQQMLIDQAATKASYDMRFQHIELMQNNMFQIVTRIEHKIDTQGKQLSEARGGLRFGKWLAATGLTLAATAMAAMAYVRGG